MNAARPKRFALAVIPAILGALLMGCHKRPTYELVMDGAPPFTLTDYATLKTEADALPHLKLLWDTLGTGVSKTFFFRRHDNSGLTTSPRYRFFKTSTGECGLERENIAGPNGTMQTDVYIDVTRGNPDWSEMELRLKEQMAMFWNLLESNRPR